MNEGATRRTIDGKRKAARTATALVGICALALLSACQSKPEPRALVIPKAKPATKEYFSEASVGVKASPRVAHPSARKRLRQGGGRAMVGKPYQVRGKWYYPQEMASYRKSGTASWYGSAFHGRLTANGEVYDMNALSAAHPTMPLPSYARVTNKANGASVIVRVNDRGPYHGGRIMDLSKRAAELLDYTHSGTAKIDVEYIGKAPVEGRDDEYLMASYRPAGGAAPDAGLPEGVMLASADAAPVPTVALAGATPSGAPAAAFPGALTDSDATAPTALPSTSGVVPVLPDVGPLPPERPAYRVAQIVAPARLGYAAERRDLDAFAAIARDGLTPASILKARETSTETTDDDYVAVGAFPTLAAARRIADAMGSIGAIEVAAVADGAKRLYAVEARPAGVHAIDAVLQAAWAAGAEEAFIVRD